MYMVDTAFSLSLSLSLSVLQGEDRTQETVIIVIITTPGLAGEQATPK